MKWHAFNLGYGLTIGRLHITWLDLWTNKYGLWIEWERKAPDVT